MWPFDADPDQAAADPAQAANVPADQSGWGGGMFSPGSLLSHPDFRRHAAYDALTNAGLGLIAASAPSSTPQNFGTMFGALAGGAAQGVQSSADRYMKMAQAGAQMRSLRMREQMWPAMMKALNEEPQAPSAAAPQQAGAPAPGGSAPSGSAGITDDNIGNVEAPAGSPTRFAQVRNFDDGVALAVKTARAYPGAFNGGKPMSIEQIAEHWAPKKDGNDPKAWAAGVSQFSGLPVDQPLDVNDPQVAAAFARGVHGQEKGGAKVIKPLDAYQPGVSVAFGGAAPPAQGDNPNAAPGQPPVQLAQAGPQLPPPPAPIPIPKALEMMRMDPMLKPVADAKIAAINKQNENAMARYKANVDIMKFGQTQANERQRLEQGERNADVMPGGMPNPSKIEYGAQAEMAKKKAESAAHEQSVFGGPNWAQVPPEQFRKLANPQVISLADGLQTGQTRLSTLGNRIGTGGVAITKADVLTAGQKLYGKDFNPDAGDIRFDWEKNATDTSHQLGKTIYSINTAYKHLNTFQDLVLAQKNGDKPMINHIIKAWNDQTGSAKYTSAETLQHALGTELAAVIKGQQLNMPEVESAVETLKTTKSEPQMLAAVNVLRHAMGDRETTITDEAAAHHVPDERIQKLIGPTAKKAITHFDEVQAQRGAPPSQQPTSVGQIPLVASPADAHKLGSGKSFRFMQNGKEMIGTVP